MKNIKYILVIAICFAFLNCATTQNQDLNDGSTIEKAIKVKSVEKEYEILAKQCVGCKLKSQGVSSRGSKSYDIMTLTKPNGEEVVYYFDITSFYGNF